MARGNTNQRLNGFNPLAYLGVDSYQPPELLIENRAPLTTDTNALIGTLWLKAATPPAVPTAEDVYMLVALNQNVATWINFSGGSTAMETLTGDTGPAVVPTAGNINVVTGLSGNLAGSTVFFSGAGSTLTLNVTSSNPQLNTIIGAQAGNLTITGGDNVGLGFGAIGDLTSGEHNTVIGANAGNLLTTGSNNTFLGRLAGASTTGDSNIVIGSSAGSALTTEDGNVLINAAGIATIENYIEVDVGGFPFMHNYPGAAPSVANGQNTFVGSRAGNMTLMNSFSNSGFGGGTLQGITTGDSNTGIGTFSLVRVTTGTGNTALGVQTGFNSPGNMGLITGNYNLLLGYTVGDTYTNAESSNILLNSSGVVAESNTLRIGESTGTGQQQLNRAFIAGVNGNTVSNAVFVTINSVTDQLGTTAIASFLETLTGNSGGAVSPTANNINVVGDGSTVNVVGNPGTSTLTISAGGGMATTYRTDSGDATPSAGIINIKAVPGIPTYNCGFTVSFTGSSNNVQLNVTDGLFNTVIGNLGGPLAGTVTGSYNTALGYGTCQNLRAGTGNLLLGVSAGGNILDGTDNIFLANPGIITDSHTLRIGLGTGTFTYYLNRAFIHGIRGITPASSDQLLTVIDDSSQLGTIASGTSGQFLKSQGAGMPPVFDNAPASSISITGDTGGALTGSSFTFTGGTTGLSFGGAGSTETLSGTLAIANGGTNATSMATTDGTVYYDGTRLVTTATGTSGQFLKSQGAGMPPVFDTVSGGSITINGDVSSVTGSTITLTGGSSGAVFTGNGTTTMTESFNFLLLPVTTSTNGQIIIGSETVLHTMGTGDQNLFVGGGAGNFTLTGTQDTACGQSALGSLTSGSQNVALGQGTLAALTSGSANVACGYLALNQLVSGTGNVCIGSQAGSSLTTNDSNNIIIGSADNGIAGLNNAIHIGFGSGGHTTCFIDGIRGITTGQADAIAVLIDSTGQLGTVSSSLRYKENIQSMEDFSSPLMFLRPVTFNYIGKPESEISVGLIAEEVHEVMPELVAYDKEGQMSSVKYHDLPVMLLNEMQKLMDRVMMLEDQIYRLERQYTK